MRVPSVGGVRVTVEAAHVRVPVRQLTERSQSEGSLLRPPRLGAPKVVDEFELKPIRDIAVRELLLHATGGTARVHLPLVPTKLRKGPFTIEIPDNSEAVIDFAVEGGRILRDRERTHGDIQPDIALPLGIKLRGVYLDDDGRIIADMARFPNLNLAFLNVARQRVPDTLEGMVELLFPDDDGGAEAAEPVERKGPSIPVDLSGLRVEAREVVPRDEELSLGQAGALQLGPATRLDVDYTHDALEIGGQFDIARSDFEGAGFAVRGLRVSGAGSAALLRTRDARRIVAELRCHELALDHAVIELQDGSRLEFSDVSAEDVDIVFTRSNGEARFHVGTDSLRAKLSGGILMMGIGRKVHPVRVAELEVEGSFKLGDHGFAIDVEVKGARIEAEQFALPLGGAYLKIASLVAAGTGRLEAGTASGWSFAGSLGVNAAVEGGKLISGPLTARLLDGTHVTLSIARLAGGHGLEEIDANGTIEIKLASGSIPIGAQSRVQFSRGAVGTLALHSLKLARGATWPTIEAGAQLTAASDGFDLEELMEFPPGLLSVRIPHIGLEDVGELVLRDLEVVLASEDAD